VAWPGRQPEAGRAAWGQSANERNRAAQAQSFVFFPLPLYRSLHISFDPWHLFLIREVLRVRTLKDFAIPGVIHLTFRVLAYGTEHVLRDWMLMRIFCNGLTNTSKT
jgi:hypothetical protein